MTARRYRRTLAAALAIATALTVAPALPAPDANARQPRAWEQTLAEYRPVPKRLRGVRTRDVAGRRVRITRACVWNPTDRVTVIICPDARVVTS